MPVKWISTEFKGVRYYESDTRKNGKRKDRYYAIRYQTTDKETGKRERREEGLGWESDKWTAEKAALTLAELRKAHTTGEGPTRLKEKREKEKARKEAEKQEKIRQQKENVTFGHYFEKTFYPISKRHKKRKTYIMEELHFRLWLKPVIGEKLLKAIKPFDLERIKKKLLDKGKSPRTVQYVFATFRQVWNMARRDGLVIDDSPTKKVKVPKFDNKRQRFLNLNEEDNLLKALLKKSRLVHDITLLSLRTGMRAGEILNLRWSHVDLHNGRILIMDAKGDKSRAAFMTDDVKAMFEMMKPITDAPGDYVFNLDGEKLSEIPWLFRKTIDELNLNEGIGDQRQRVCFHTCRHTFASRLAESGVDLYTIKTLLGHSTISLTERYSHLGDSSMQDAIKKFDAMVKARSEEISKKETTKAANR